MAYKALCVISIILILLCSGCERNRNMIPDEAMEEYFSSKSMDKQGKIEAAVTWSEIVRGKDVTIDVNSTITVPNSTEFPAAKASIKRFSMNDYCSILQSILRFNGQLDNQVDLKNQLTDHQTDKEFELKTELPDWELAILFGKIGANDCAYSVQNIIQNEEMVLAGDAIIGEPAGTRISEISMNKTDAIELTRQFLSDNGITDMGISSLTPAREVSVSEASHEIISTGYYITYTKQIQLLETPAQWRYYIRRDGEEIMHRAQISVERICFYIANQEIRVFLWNNATECAEIINNNIEVLSFADIQKRIMCKLIDRYSNHWVHLRQTNQTLCIKVSDVKLGICHIGTSMDENTIFYVPSWYAFYTETYFIGGEIVSVLNDYLVICAVDGTQLEPRMPTQ